MLKPSIKPLRLGGSTSGLFGGSGGLFESSLVLAGFDQMPIWHFAFGQAQLPLLVVFLVGPEGSLELRPPAAMGSLAGPLGASLVAQPRVGCSPACRRAVQAVAFLAQEVAYLVRISDKTGATLQVVTHETTASSGDKP